MESVWETRATLAVWQYCPPFLLVFGTFGNVMTVVIVRRMKMAPGSAMPVYLTALALFDASVLYTGLLDIWINNAFHLNFRTLHPAICKIHPWLVYSFINMSSWVLIFMTVERTLSVWRPHHVSLLCTRTKAKVIIVVIFISSLLVNSHMLYGVAVLNNNGTLTCYALVGEYQYFFDVIWSWIDLTLASLIPFGVLLLCNCIILWKISLSQRSARYLGTIRSGGTVTQQRRKTSSMTVMLLSLSLFFFLTTAPISIYNVIEEYIEITLSENSRGWKHLAFSWAVVNILSYCNNAFNFYLYCLSGTKFRTELRKFFCCPEAVQISSTNQGVYAIPSHDNPILQNGNENQHSLCLMSPKARPANQVWFEQTTDF